MRRKHEGEEAGENAERSPTLSGGGATAHGLSERAACTTAVRTRAGGQVGAPRLGRVHDGQGAQQAGTHSDVQSTPSISRRSNRSRREGKKWRYTRARDSPIFVPDIIISKRTNIQRLPPELRSGCNHDPPSSSSMHPNYCAPLLVPAISGDYFCALREFPRPGFW
ncbi:hypothetical protein C8R44DRAFT_733886 [Mycena epipterygia]|nr:hypothetical protein C8R44DRAFT_733886 [Mycena epipterygia]